MNPQFQAMLQNAIQAYQMGHLKKAEEILSHCVYLDSNFFDGLHLLAIVYASQNNHQAAISYYKKSLQLQPNHASALSNLGSSLNSMGLNQEALVVFQRAQEIEPNTPEFWFNAANVLYDMGRYEEALTYYERSIDLNPYYYQAYNNFGKALFELKNYLDSLAYFDEALNINQNFLDCLINKSLALNELKRYDEAIAHCDNALRLEPDSHEAWINKGVALYELKRYDEAIAHYDMALRIKPEYAEGWSNIGVVLNELKRYDEAITHFDQALKLKPDYAKCWSNKGNTLEELKRYREAIVHYNKALTLKSDIDWVLGDLLLVKMKICSWSDIEDLLETVSNKLKANEKVLQPFPLLVLSDDAFLHKKCSEIYAESKYPFNPDLGVISKYPRGEKIRIGYFSSDFRNHAVSFLTAELFELHDKNQFEIIAFSFGVDDKSRMRSRLSEAFNRFIDVSGMSDLEIAKLSRGLRVDIAVDLGGYTAGARTSIFSYRAAPIQVSYLGYLGTMGAEYIDYILADKTLIPEGLQKFYTEKITYLPSYQANDRKRLISNKQFTREELGLPDTAFIYVLLRVWFTFRYISHYLVI
jgi:predicted O-linked N-acetylglucosamine transferase (SPINDLY family)